MVVINTGFSVTCFVHSNPDCTKHFLCNLGQVFMASFLPYKMTVIIVPPHTLCQDLMIESI